MASRKKPGPVSQSVAERGFQNHAEHTGRPAQWVSKTSCVPMAKLSVSITKFDDGNDSNWILEIRGNGGKEYLGSISLDNTETRHLAEMILKTP